MKILISLCICILILSSCGKKSEPQYQSKLERIQIVL